MEANSHSQLQENMVDNRGWEYSGAAEYAPNACEFYNINATSTAKVCDPFARPCNRSLGDAGRDRVTVGAAVLTWLQQICFAT